VPVEAVAHGGLRLHGSLARHRRDIPRRSREPCPHHAPHNDCRFPQRCPLAGAATRARVDGGGLFGRGGPVHIVHTVRLARIPAAPLAL